METVILLETAVWKVSTEIYVVCSGAYVMSYTEMLISSYTPEL
jgi:hypothetical protein